MNLHHANQKKRKQEICLNSKEKTQVQMEDPHFEAEMRTCLQDQQFEEKS